MNPSKLLLMRHAKSDWDDRSLSDYERPLNRRGRGDAPRMAAWIESIDAIPTVILCSSATRTMQTAELMIRIWGTDPKLIDSERLYLSSPEIILRLIDTTSSSAKRLLVIAHNPGISTLTSHFANQMIQMPTAAVAVFSAAESGDVKATGEPDLQLQCFMRPKDLPTPDDAETDAPAL